MMRLSELFLEFVNVFIEVSRNFVKKKFLLHKAA